MARALEVPAELPGGQAALGRDNVAVLPRGSLVGAVEEVLELSELGFSLLQASRLAADETEDLVESGPVEAPDDPLVVDHDERRHLPVKVLPLLARGGVAIHPQLTEADAKLREAIAHHG